MRKTLNLTLASVFGFSLLGVQGTVPLCSVAADLKTIVDRGRIVIAVKDNLVPLGFRDAKGNLQGFEIEIAQRLAKEILGRSDAIEFKPVLNRDRISVLTDDKADITIARLTVTSSRARVVAFSQPYYLDGTGLVSRASIQKESDLKDQTIAVLNDSSTIPILKYRLPQAKLIGVASYQDGQKLVESGKAIALAADISVLSGWVKEFPGYQVSPLRLSTEALAIAIPKGIQYDELRRRIDFALSKWKAEGWLQQRAIYWGLPWDTLK
jgi:polar amino acid transport system substrate-binding protein